MNFEEYQISASRTINPNLSKPQLTAHALYGLASEVGETLGLYQKEYQGHILDKERVASELGDLLWFIAEWCTANGYSMNYLAEHNKEKLEKRYKKGFSEEESLHRAEGDI